MIEEKKGELQQYIQDKNRVRDENQRYKSQLMQAQEELEQLRRVKKDYETKFQKQEEVLLNLQEENDELNKQIDIDADNMGSMNKKSRRFDFNLDKNDKP